jgi:AraC family transcriptional regulator of adaptative response/methylated-DNA-[protein]-cysteine methyltransferase
MDATVTSNPTDTARWRAVETRRPGAFVYAVVTTGIYCRPDCPARRPRRVNVRFFDDPAQAAAAGFRPCRRCRPDRPDARPDARAALVVGACRAIEAAETPPRLAALAAGAGLSPFHFHRLFRAATGVTPHEYAAACRARRARDALGEAGTVTAALYDAGFGSAGRFYAEAPGRLGMTPGRFRAGGAGESIRFAVGQGSLGAVLVAATDRGICAVALGDDPQALLDDLQALFPRAALVGADSQFERWVAQVVGLVEEPSRGLGLPLDIRGTAFQQRVWRALREIPCGETLSYAELARRLGVPGSARAVAGACAANRIAVAIPCHRVVRTGGGLAGYRWGIERKRALLDRERGG